MNIFIYSREEAEELIAKDKFPKHAAVISFYDDVLKRIDDEYKPVNYSKTGCKVIYAEISDIDITCLEEAGLSYDDFFPSVNKVAFFIYKAYQKGMDIICQCEHGQGRSAACAAAIREYFLNDGIKIFTDYRYSPNLMVYHKVFDALKKVEKYNKSIFFYHAKEDFIKSRLDKYCCFDELFGKFDFGSRISCIKAKDKIEAYLRKENLLCESVTDAVNKFKKGTPFPFISLKATDSETYYDSPHGISPTRLISEYKYGCEKIHTVIWLYDSSITAERKRDGVIEKRDIYFGRAFDSFNVKQYNVLGTMYWDENNKELTIVPFMITDIIFSQYTSYSGKSRKLL